jgi:hypothetical protein
MVPISFEKYAKRKALQALESISAIWPKHWNAWRLSHAQSAVAPVPVRLDLAARSCAIEWAAAPPPATE